jgi:hypothetical protein
MVAHQTGDVGIVFNDEDGGFHRVIVAGMEVGRLFGCCSWLNRTMTESADVQGMINER